MSQIQIRVPLIFKGDPDMVFAQISELMKFLKMYDIDVVLADISIDSGTENLKRVSIDTPIESLGLSERPYQCLKRAKISTLGELLLKTPADLLAITNFGQKSVDEVVVKLDELGYTLRAG